MISIVVPVYNEEESLKIFYKELIASLQKIKEEVEILFVDDGSTDASLAILQELKKNNKNIRLYSFRKNAGKSEVLSFAFQKAQGEYVVTLDADLQDKPDQIQKLLDVAREGYELVCGWRKDRKDPLQKNISSKIFNMLANKFWGLSLHDYNCGLKLYTREAAQSLHMYGGLHRFIPLLVYQKGFSVTEVPVVHQKRQFGKSKYGFSKLWKDLPDIFTMIFLSKYEERPLHFFGPIGGFVFGLGTLVLLYLAILKIFFGQGIGDRPLFFLGILMVLSGLQVLFTGFLADLFINISHKNTGSSQSLKLRYSSDEK